MNMLTADFIDYHEDCINLYFDNILILNLWNFGSDYKQIMLNIIYVVIVFVMKKVSCNQFYENTPEIKIN